MVNIYRPDMEFMDGSNSTYVHPNYLIGIPFNKYGSLLSHLQAKHPEEYKQCTNAHRHTHADIRRRMQGKLRPACGRMQPQDASRR